MKKLFLIAALLVSSSALAEPVKRTLCIYDPSGESGEFYKRSVPYALAALDWGVDFGHPQVRQDEKIAAEDFRAGKCDAVIMTGSRARQFVLGPGTLEAIGALQSYKELKTVVGALARPAEAKLMRVGEYESVGIIPAGAIYLFVRDRNIKETSDLAGHRISVLDFDTPSNYLVERIGAAAVSADTSTFSGMFNSGGVDAAYAPITVFKALELMKGVGKKGGVVHLPLAELTSQVVTRTARMPDGFGDASRKYLAEQYDANLQSVERCENDVPKSAWIEVPNQRGYDALFQAVRVDLGARGVYDKTMLHKLMLVRCREDPARAECAEKKE